MPRKEHVVVVPKEALPAITLEVRVLVEDTDDNDGNSKILAGRLEFTGQPTVEDLQNAIFDLAVETINAASWDIGLGEIFEVEAVKE